MRIPRLNVDRLIAVAGVAVAIIALTRPWQLVFQPPPPLGEQLDAIRSDLARQGREITLTRRVQLHGAAPSYLIASTPVHLPGGRRLDFSFSDEVTIYDVEDQRLRQAISFRPTVDPGPAHGMSLDFKLLATGDLNGDGLGEIVGDFKSSVMHFVENPRAGLDYPLALAWDAKAGRYRITPLLREPPEGLKFRNPGGLARREVAQYRRPVALVDAPGGTSVRSFASDGAVIVRRGRQRFLVADYVVRDQGHILVVDPRTGGFDFQHRVTEAIQGALMSRGAGAVELLPCPSPRLNLLGPISHGDLSPTEIRQAWQRFVPASICH
jgi:hypothetical protein